MGRAVCFSEPHNTYLSKALKTVLQVLSPNTIFMCYDEGPIPSPQIPVGLMMIWAPEDFAARFQRLSAKDCHYMVVSSVIGTELPPWGQRPPTVAGRFRDRCVQSSLGLNEILRFIDSQLKKQVPGKLGGRDLCDRAIEATRLYGLIRSFAHGAKGDITNALLGPARLLRGHKRALRVRTTPEQGNLLTDIKTQFDNVCDKIEGSPGCYGQLGDELLEAWKPIKNHVEEIPDSCQWIAELSQTTVGELERFIEALTEVRELAGEPVRVNANSSPAPVLPIPAPDGPSPKRGYRVLVVDDFAWAWRPVIEVVADELSKSGLPITFEFSCDGHNVQLSDNTSIKLDRVLVEYDLILLDIYLPKERATDAGKGSSLTGLEILKKIRARSISVPVILWTTSLDRNLAAQASLANGFLFKKTATCKDIVKLLETWLESGRSRRLWSLPNPLFDHILQDTQNTKLRELALGFTKWTLRYMDCFHAIDHFYFQYYNDHGGRHILGVLDALAKLLRPFLFESGGVLSDRPDIRAKQVFCMYVAVLCHEFGMFPIYETESPKAKGSPPKGDLSYVDAVRKLHAIRGLLLLQTKPEEAEAIYRIDGCKKYLRELNNVVEAEGSASVALLVGYHQRCLSLKEPKDGLNATRFRKVNKNALKKIEESRKVVSKSSKYDRLAGDSWLNADFVADVSLSAWEEVERGQNPIWTRCALRKMCAVLRFADALDVDHTRIPADFLLDQRSKRRPIQDMEDCKRQVLESVEIDRGRVSLIFSLSEPDKRMATVLSYFASKALKECNIMLKRKRQVGAVLKGVGTDFGELRKKLEKKRGVDGRWFERFKVPWYKGVAAIRMSKDNPNAKFLEGCLQVYFTLMRFPRTKAPSDEVKCAMAVAAAILVVLEIQDEYKAIKDVKLEDHICLDTVKWTNDRGLPSILNWESKS